MTGWGLKEAGLQRHVGKSRKNLELWDFISCDFVENSVPEFVRREQWLLFSVPQSAIKGGWHMLHNTTTLNILIHLVADSVVTSVLVVVSFTRKWKKHSYSFSTQIVDAQASSVFNTTIFTFSWWQCTRYIDINAAISAITHAHNTYRVTSRSFTA